MIEIPLISSKRPGLVALIDDEDFELVSQHRWYPLQVKANSPTYAITSVRSDNTQSGTTSIRMHRLIVGLDTPGDIDHKDRNPLNNTRANLRKATSTQNRGNQRKAPSRSQFKGIRERRGRYESRFIIYDNGRDKYYYLGDYDTERSAALAYDVAARHWFGEFATLNFPDVITPVSSLPEVARRNLAKLMNRCRLQSKYDKPC